jgi:hypothetical protein
VRTICPLISFVNECKGRVSGRASEHVKGCGGCVESVEKVVQEDPLRECFQRNELFRSELVCSGKGITVFR